MPVPGANYSYDYEKIVSEINQLRTGDENKLLHFMRYWCEEDLFFLLYFILRVPVNHPWLVERIKEVQTINDQTLDLWFREGFKSTIITYGLNIQCILRDPNERIGIFSHTRSIAKAFLRRIKLTFESNDLLKALFPDILYQNPTSQSPKWSEDDGVMVNRPSVFQESTVEAWGLTDGQPTSKHFSILNYDDIVTIDSVGTADQLKKTDECFKMSDNLGADGGIKRVIGTIYHFNDQHIKLMEQGGWHVRKHPAELPDGTPVFLSEEKLAKKRRDLGPYVYSTQMLLNPIAKKDQRFRYEWLKWYRTLPSQLSLYLLCDPANEKKRKLTGSDYTVYWLWGLDTNDNKFLVDAIRDKLTLTERWKYLKDMRAKYPKIQRIGYEQYGMTADIQHFESMMEIEGNYFSHLIVELGGNKLSKEDRIARLIPAFEQGRIYLPEHLEYEDKEGNIVDLVRVFVNDEYLKFPFSQHDDLLDAASRVEDKILDASKPLDDAYEDDEIVQHDIAGFFNQIRRGDDDGGRDYITGY
jgi:predicted phage terminase large subunit-like protein